MVETDTKDIKLEKDGFIHMTKDSLTDFYTIVKILGEGGFGKVYEVTNKKTSKAYACKKISKTNIMDLEKLKEQIKTLSKEKHPNITDIYEVYESNRSLYIIAELCKGGRLLYKITERAEKKKMYTEEDAEKIFKQIMLAIEYCHAHGICHRDIKPENILYLNESDDEKNNPLKIIDFGLGRYFKIGKLSSRIGGLYYCSPEVLENKYNEKCDIWSAGVVLYLLLSGTLPFKGKEEKEIIESIKVCKYEMSDSIWNNISDEAKDLIKHMLLPENERYSAKEVLAHPWFKNKDNIKNKIDIDFYVFKKYSEQNTLKKLVLNCIATKLKEKDIKELNELFKKFDTNLDGQISLEEFERIFLKFQNKIGVIKKNDIQQIFDMIDLNKNGIIDYTEFIAASLEGRKEIVERKLLEAFFTYDKEQTGKINKNDFIKVLNVDESLKEKGFEKIIDNICKDDMVDYNEFLKLL